MEREIQTKLSIMSERDTGEREEESQEKATTKPLKKTKQPHTGISERKQNIE